MTIVEFLRARLDEEAEVARAANDARGRWIPNGYGNVNAADPTDGTVTHIATAGTGAIAVHMVRHSPARVLREVEAKRAIVAMHRRHRWPEHLGKGIDRVGCSEPVGRDGACTTLRLLALPYADHRDHNAAWTVALDN